MADFDESMRAAREDLDQMATDTPQPELLARVLHAILDMLQELREL